MRLLIDTQAILWFQESNQKLSPRAKDIILNKDNECLISVASLWEMAIKVGLDKLHIDMGFENFPKFLVQHDFDILGITQQHILGLLTLPKFDHHKDPFDRLLIAQAISEDLTIISADRHFDSYPVQVVW